MTRTPSLFSAAVSEKRMNVVRRVERLPVLVWLLPRAVMVCALRIESRQG